MNKPSGTLAFTYGENLDIDVIDNYSVKYNTTIMTTEAGSYTFILKWDDSWNLTFDGSLRINLTSSVDRVSEVNANFTVDLEANTYYPTFIEFQKYTGNSKLQLYWIRPGQSAEEIVPQENLWFDHYYGGQRLEINVACPVGYSVSEFEGEAFCHKTWGDGFRIEDEKWDDLNTNNGDGCNSNWVVEEGFICTGGNATVSDKWIRCPVGYESFRYFENTDYVECRPETDKYDVVFYITIVVLMIGMVKYFMKDFIRVYNLDEKIKSERQINKYEQEECQNILEENQKRKEDKNYQKDKEMENDENEIEKNNNIEFHR